MFRMRIPTAVFALAASIYVATLGARALQTSADDHFSHLAESWLHGQWHAVGNRPDGTNDWACFDTEERGPCPQNNFRVGGERYRWYVSFPPFPAVLLVPIVAMVGGVEFPDRLVWAIVAAFAPALLFMLLRRLSETGRSRLSTLENLGLTVLFALGTVYFFTAVQGTVWFAAHAVACALLVLFVFFSIDAQHPFLAGLVLSACFMTRPTTALLALFFGLESLRAATRHEGQAEAYDGQENQFEVPWERKLYRFLRSVCWKQVLRKLAIFSIPVVIVAVIAMGINALRFDDPFEFGHSYLQIRWRYRIEKWGLFNYHFLAKNLAVFSSSLPWLSSEPPFLKIGRHGLALWFTTPGLLFALFPKIRSGLYTTAALSIVPIALTNLCYQNSGWAQFGYRFALDYLILVFVLIAVSRRTLRSGFWALAVFAIIVNTFGAITFDRIPMFYDSDPTQNILFQPD